MLGSSGGDHVLGRLFSPAVDEIAVGAVRVSAGELEGSSAAPSVGEGLAQVVPDAEAKLWHGLHVLGAPVGCAVCATLVGDLEGRLVDTVGEVKQSLEMGRARALGEAIRIKSHGVALAEPFNLGVRRAGARRLGCGITSKHPQVLGHGHLGLRIAQTVVCAEAEQRDGRIRAAAIFGVNQSRDPVDGQVVGVAGVGAPGLEFCTGLGVGSHAVGTKECVEMGLAVAAGENDGINVLVENGCHDVHLGIAVDGLGQKAGGKRDFCGGKHPVLFR